MRNLKKLCAACVLTLVLALPAFAGNMLAGVTGEMPTGVMGNMETGVTGEMTTGVTGEMSTGITGNMSTGVTSTDPATDVLLSLLQSLLSLF